MDTFIPSIICISNGIWIFFSLLNILKLIFLLLLFVQAPEFPEFTAKVEEAISSLGGSVFPKLNWSAPRVRMLTPKTWNRCYHEAFSDYLFYLNALESRRV